MHATSSPARRPLECALSDAADMEALKREGSAGAAGGQRSAAGADLAANANAWLLALQEALFL